MKLQNIFLLLFATFLIMIVIGSCHCNEPPPSGFIPPTIDGNYRGWYTYIDVNTNDTLTQTIMWSFTDTEYEMKIDFESIEFSDFCLCESNGQYLLEDRLRLMEDSSKSFKFICDECDNTKNPTGLFLVDRSTDYLVMTQQITEGEVSIIKKIRLLELGDI